MNGAHASAPAATYAIAHAVWQVALIAAAYALAGRTLRRAAARHAVGMAALVVSVAVLVATFAMYRAPVHGAGPPPRMIGGTDWLALIVPIVWLAGALGLAARQLAGWWAVRALRCGAAPGAWVLRIDALRRRLAIGRAIAVRVGPSPFTAFARRPTVWLPAGWDALPAGQRDALAAHELAHVRRLDWIWHAVQCALEAVLWFHPAARWLARRVRQEREHACDDLVVATCGDPIALVEALVALEHGARASVLSARGGALVERTRRLLGAPAPAPLPVAAIGTLVLGALLASRIALPRDMLLGLRVDASTSGALTPGTYRDITTDAFLDRRHYHGAMDARGQLHEVYEENGVARPLDVSVRAWLDELIVIDAR